VTAAGRFRSIAVATRPVADVRRIPWLAAAQLIDGGRKTRGARRVFYKLCKALFRLVHQRLRIPAWGLLVIDPAGTPRRFRADFANTAYIDFANRSAREGYEPETTALCEIVAPAARVVYDIGANWGYFIAVLCSNARFHGTIHAFEIAPRTFRDLTRLVAACGASSRIRCHAFGLSERHGDASIQEGMHSALSRISPRSSGRRVRVESLDRLGLPDPDFIKIDVEGHEAAVFRGALETIVRAKPLIVFESWHTPGAPAAMLEPMQILSGVGYDFFRISWVPGAGAGTLNLIALPIDERPSFPEALNILAVHADSYLDIGIPA
jgi:FkbM family methyltransferase